MNGALWSLHVVGGPDDVHRHVLPRFGGWTLVALLDQMPRASGPHAVREQSPPWPVYDLRGCAACGVRAVQIRPARP